MKKDRVFEVAYRDAAFWGFDSAEEAEACGFVIDDVFVVAADGSARISMSLTEAEAVVSQLQTLLASHKATAPFSVGQSVQWTDGYGHRWPAVIVEVGPNGVKSQELRNNSTRRFTLWGDENAWRCGTMILILEEPIER